MAAWYMEEGDQYIWSATRARWPTAGRARAWNSRLWHFGYPAKVTRPAGQQPQGDIGRRLWRVAGWGALSTLVVVRRRPGASSGCGWDPTDQTALAHVGADVQNEFAALTRSLATTAQQLARQPGLTGNWPIRRRTHPRVVRPGRPPAGRVSPVARRRLGLRQHRPAHRVGRSAIDAACRSAVRSVRRVCRAGLARATRRARRADRGRRRRGPAGSAPWLPKPSCRVTACNGDPVASPIFESALVPLTLREVYAGAGETLSPYAFALTTTSGAPLLTAVVPPRGLSDLRAAWRGRTIGRRAAGAGGDAGPAGARAPRRAGTRARRRSLHGAAAGDGRACWWRRAP